MLFRPDGTVHEIPAGQPDLEEATVFELVPVPLDIPLQLVTGVTQDRVPEVLVQLARRCIVGWKNLIDQDGIAVPFSVDLISSGLLPIDVTLALVLWLPEQAGNRKEQDGKNAHSGPTPETTPSGGTDTEGSGAASSATN